MGQHAAKFGIAIATALTPKLSSNAGLSAAILIRHACCFSICRSLTERKAEGFAMSSSPTPSSPESPSPQARLRKRSQTPIWILLGIIAVLAVIVLGYFVFADSTPTADARGGNDAGVVHPQPLGVDDDLSY